MSAAPFHKQNKYRAVKTTLDGITFDSKAEAMRYAVLKLREKVGEIRDLDLQPEYPLVINGVRVGRIRLDFRYLEDARGLVIEDVKSEPTRKGEAYQLRKKVFEALYGLTVTEVTA